MSQEPSEHEKAETERQARSTTFSVEIPKKRKKRLYTTEDAITFMNMTREGSTLAEIGKVLGRSIPSLSQFKTSLITKGVNFPKSPNLTRASDRIDLSALNNLDKNDQD